MGPDEWLSLPWWLEQVYIDGFVEEGILKRQGDGRSATPSPVAPQREKTDPALATDDELQAMGLTVITGGVRRG
jgi:hypothetical protein